MNVSTEWWLGGFDEPITGTDHAIPAVHRDAVDEFAGRMVFVEFDSDHRDRHPVIGDLAGHPGRWMSAYSRHERLLKARTFDDEIEYSRLLGGLVIRLLPPGVGLWLDPGFATGHPIILPPLPLSRSDDQPDDDPKPESP